MAHRPASQSHPVRACPACRLGEALALLNESRQFIERVAGTLDC